MRVTPHTSRVPLISGAVLGIAGWVGLLGAALSAGAFGCDEKPQASGGPAATASTNAANPAPSASGSARASAAASASSAASGSAAPRADGTLEITLLITADENGHLLPSEGAPPRGGAAEMLTKWVKDERHCVGSAEKCNASSTLALSTGDHYAGPAISTYFSGESTAEVMGVMGYQASAFGNHELDFGEPAFVKFATTSKLNHTAANMTLKAGSPLAERVSPHLSFVRNGVSIAVVGLAGVNTAKTSMANRFEGVTFAPYEAALAEAVPKAWKEGADAVVVLAHECPEVLEPIIAKHPDWRVALVAGAHCTKEITKAAGVTKIASCGRHFEQYLRATLRVDKKKPAAERLIEVTAARIDVQGVEPEAGAKAIVAKWKKKLDGELAEEIGFAQKGYAKESPELAKLFLGAIRKQLGADVALANRQGFRGTIAAGPVTRASVYGAIPYENAVLLVSVPGDALAKELARDTAAFEGVTGSAKQGFTIGGKPLEAAKKYKVATLDFLYFGGDGFELAKVDPSPQETGMVWQTPVIDFLKKNKTTKASPLEDLAKKP